MSGTSKGRERFRPLIVGIVGLAILVSSFFGTLFVTDYFDHRLPQHFDFLASQNYSIHLVLVIGKVQVPSATVLQCYDSASQGFSIEYTSPGRLTFFMHGVEGKTDAAAYEVPADIPVTFDLVVRDGHPVLTVDGTKVFEENVHRLGQKKSEIWIGGSGIYPERKLNGQLVQFIKNGA